MISLCWRVVSLHGESVVILTASRSKSCGTSSRLREPQHCNCLVVVTDERPPVSRCLSVCLLLLILKHVISLSGPSFSITGRGIHERT